MNTETSSEGGAKEGAASALDDGLGGNWYAVACGVSKTGGLQHTNSLTLHTRFAATEEEAKGSAVLEAMALKPGFAVWEVVCLKVPAPPNHQISGGTSAASDS